MKITFKTEAALSSFHSMCEGMWEVARDDWDRRDNNFGYTPATLDELIKITAGDSFPRIVELSDNLEAAASDVLENLSESEDEDFGDIEVQGDAKNETVTFEQYIKQMPRAELGGLLKEYIAESNHNGWNGFERHHLIGIRAFLADLKLYHENYHHEDRAEHLARQISNVNPVA